MKNGNAIFLSMILIGVVGGIVASAQGSNGLVVGIAFTFGSLVAFLLIGVIGDALSSHDGGDD